MTTFYEKHNGKLVKKNTPSSDMFTPTFRAPKVATSNMYLPLVNKDTDWSYLSQRPKTTVATPTVYKSGVPATETPTDTSSTGTTFKTPKNNADAIIMEYKTKLDATSNPVEKAALMKEATAKYKSMGVNKTGAVEGTLLSIGASAADIIGNSVEYFMNVEQEASSVGRFIVGKTIEPIIGKKTAEKLLMGSYTDKYYDEQTVIFNEYLKKADATSSWTEKASLLKEGYDKAKEVANVRAFNLVSGENTSTAPLANMYSQAKKSLRDLKNESVQTLTNKADLQNESAFTQWTANMLSSFPYTAVSRIPLGIGAMLNYGSSYMSSYYQKVAEAEAAGTPLTNEQKADIMNYAASSAAINAGTEQIFPAGKGALNLGKALATSSFKNISKETIKFLLKQGAQEATEEGLSYIGQGIAAKFTTDPDATFLGVASQSALINLADLGNTMLSAFTMGVVFSGVGIGGSGIKSKISNNYAGFKNSADFYNKNKDVALNEFTPEIIQEGETAFKEDIQNSENREIVQKQAVEAVTNVEQNMPINEQIEMYQNILIELHNDVQSNKTPEQEAAYKTYVADINQKITDLQRIRTTVTPKGEKRTISQIEKNLQLHEDYLQSLKEDFAKATTSEERASIQEDIDHAITNVNNYKSILEKATQPELTSKQMLANMKASRKPVAQSNAVDSKVATSSVTTPVEVTRAVQKASVSMPEAQVSSDRLLSLRAGLAKATSPAEKTMLQDAIDSIASPVQSETTPIVPKQTYAEASKAQSEALSKESMKAHPPTGIQHIIDPSIRKFWDSAEINVRAKLTLAEKGTYKKTQSEETIRRIEAARNPARNSRLFRNKLREFFTSPEYRKKAIEKARIVLTYGAVPLTRKYGDILRTWRNVQKSNGLASNEALLIVETIYSQVPVDKLKLFYDVLIYRDMKEDIELGTWHGDRFGIQSKGEALTTHAAIERELKMPGNEKLVELIETRKKLMDNVRDELIDLAAEVGLDFSYIKDRRYDYVYHAILQFTPEFTGMDFETFKKKNFVGYKEREGGEKDYISNPFYADYMVLFNMNKNMFYIDLYKTIKKQDVSKKYGKDDDGNLVVPKGYSLLDPSCFRIKQFDEQSTKEMIAKAYKEMDKEKVLSDSEKGQAILRKWGKRADRVTLVVPIEIVEAINKEFPYVPEKGVSKVLRFLTKGFKFTAIRLPHRVIKYNVRNMTGDFDAVFAGKWEILKPSMLFPAIDELGNYFMKHSITNPLLHEYIRRYGMSSSQTITEYGDLMKRAKMAAASEKDVVKAAKFIWKEILTLESFTDFREQILRYAAFKSWVQEMEGTKNNLPNNYGASYKEEIDSIENIYDRAVKLSNDMLGAYDDVGKFGVYLSDHVFPFLRFRVLNFKRDIKLYENAIFNNGKNETTTQAKMLWKRAGAIGKLTGNSLFKTAKLTAKISASVLTWSLLNSLFAPDEEDELPDYVKETPHITIPRVLTRWFGGERIYYMDKLGSFQDLAGMFGLDMSTGEDMIRIVSGKISLTDWISETSKEASLDWVNSSFPIGKLFLAYALGVDYYPDASNPREIYDKMEFTMKQVGLDDEWRALNGLPIKNGNWLVNENMDNLMNSVLPGDASIYDVNDMITDFMQENNYSYMDKKYTQLVPDSLEAKRSSAAYNYKLALKLGDKNAAEKYLIEYAYYGGTGKTIAATIRAGQNYTWLKKDQKTEFVASLNAEEKETFDRYEAYIAWLTDTSKEGLDDYANSQ
jgi:hypothetical protein